MVLKYTVLYVSAFSVLAINMLCLAYLLLYCTSTLRCKKVMCLHVPHPWPQPGHSRETRPYIKETNINGTALRKPTHQTISQAAIINDTKVRLTLHNKRLRFPRRPNTNAVVLRLINYGAATMAETEQVAKQLYSGKKSQYCR